jgi:hypothetical protein
MAYEGLSFSVVELERGHRYTLYTVQFQGSDRTEFEKWVHDEDINSHDEFSRVYSSFRAISDQGLPDDCFFKQEDYEDYGWVTPFRSEERHAELRLYCIRRENANWVLAGNGCIKPDGGPLQQFPDCDFAFNNILSIDRRIRQRISDGTDLERGNRGEHLVENRFYLPE